MSDQDFIQVQVAGFGDEVTARYYGGPYIELGWLQDGTGEFSAYDVINVYDYAEGAPRIENTPSAVREAVENWLADQADEGDQ